ncbi:hypothetical protein NQ314_008910 [Rhamnusium bicolor]|uniref:Endonuclease/exonuclease/phosphatase domain-containing protein n=1 Tax=Rhamnusium bicolor TaxID=1586634 RepID=A0AAV8Y5A0_9CUCU|nr:hypothetical protein NQ314_008910 [Rhamnusium bicolor]
MATNLPIITNLEATVIHISTPKSIYICNIYIPPNQDINPVEINNLTEQIPMPRIILGDFNGHNCIWGSDTTNARGRTLENIIDATKLILLNNSEKTRFDSFTGNSSVLDLTLCDPALFPTLVWETLPYLYGSDHYPILITNQNGHDHYTTPL